MTRHIFRIVGVLLACMLLVTGTALAKSAQQQREEIQNLQTKALTNLYKQKPHARNVIESCYGYATISATGSQLGITGDAHGRGLAVNNHTGERIYMKMQEYKLGFGFGIKEYDLIFVFGTPDAWKNFISGKFKFGGEAGASATDSVSGGTMDGATMVDEGIWVYQTTTKGLSADVSVKGMSIYPNKKLNDKNAK